MELISRLGSSGPTANTSVNKSDNCENCAERPHANELLGCSNFRSVTRIRTLFSSHDNYKVLIVEVHTAKPQIGVESGAQGALKNSQTRAVNPMPKP